MKCFKQPSTSNACRQVFITLGTLLSLSIMGEANADCTFDPGYPAATYNLAHSASISVPRDTPDGTVIHTDNARVPSRTTVNCSSPDFELSGTKSLVGIQPPDLQEKTIFPIGTTGLGFRWSLLARGGQLYLGPYGYKYISSFNQFSNTYFELIKIGPIKTGTEVPPGNVATFAIGSLNPVLTLNLPQKIVITQPSCTTPDVTVPMGTQKTSGFSGMNSRLRPVPFAIKLDACPTGINAVKYRLDPTTPLLDQTASVVALSADATATGVGVQILDNFDKALPLGADHVFLNYSPAGGNFSIPLKAAYYQTDKSVKGGSANTALTFTMTYE